jgi:hypothetical protein
MAYHVNEGDEASFVELAESMIQNFQKLAKTKVQLQYSSVINACMKLEDMAYMEALKDASLAPSANVWQYRRAIEAYQDICETIARNLESSIQKDWHVKFYENPPLRLFRQLSGRVGIAAGVEEIQLGGKRRGPSEKSSGNKGKKYKKKKGGPIAKATEVGIAPTTAHGGGTFVANQPKIEATSDKGMPIFAMPS